MHRDAQHIVVTLALFAGWLLAVLVATIAWGVLAGVLAWLLGPVVIVLVILGLTALEDRRDARRACMEDHPAGKGRPLRMVTL